MMERSCTTVEEVRLMKKKYWAALAAGTAAGLWCVRRDRKYPVCRELRFVNKLVVPGCAVSLKPVKMANRVLSRLPLPEPPLPMSMLPRAW